MVKCSSSTVAKSNPSSMPDGTREDNCGYDRSTRFRAAAWRLGSRRWLERGEDQTAEAPIERDQLRKLQRDQHARQHPKRLHVPDHPRPEKGLDGGVLLPSLAQQQETERGAVYL